MTIGRLVIGFISGKPGFGIYHTECGCHLLDLGWLYITWYGKDCKCTGCKQHICKCET